MCRSYCWFKFMLSLKRLTFTTLDSGIKVGSAQEYSLWLCVLKCFRMLKKINHKMTAVKLKLYCDVKIFKRGLYVYFLPYVYSRRKRRSVLKRGGGFYFLSFVALLRIFFQIFISYCKFIMSKALKWCMLHLCTLIFH